MPFYKRDGDTLMDAPNFVIGPDFELRAETYEENTYPVDGWYWFDNLDSALVGLPKKISIDVVTMRQARLALLSSGLLTLVNTAVAGMSGIAGDAARIEWEYASEIRRDSTLVLGLSSTLGLTVEQLDELFLVASRIS